MGFSTTDGATVLRARAHDAYTRSGTAHARPHAAAQLVPINKFRGAGVDLDEPTQDLGMPDVDWAVAAQHKTVCELRAFCFRKPERIGTDLIQRRARHG